MDLSKKEYGTLLGMIDGLKTGSELEARIGRSKDAGNRTGYIVSNFSFENLLMRLTFDPANGGMGLPSQQSIILDVKQDGVRVRLNDANSVKRYIVLGKTDGLCLSAIDSIEKNKSGNLDIPEYNLRISVSQEGKKKMDLSQIKDILSNNKPKIFRYKKQYSVITKDGKFRYDLSIVKQVHNYRLTERDIAHQEPQYEIEIEYIGNNPEAIEEAQRIANISAEPISEKTEHNNKNAKDSKNAKQKNNKKNKKKSKKNEEVEKEEEPYVEEEELEENQTGGSKGSEILDQFIGHIGTALQAFQDSFILSKNSERREVIENYMKHLNLDGDLNSKTDFICPEPVTLHRRNVVKVRGQPSIMDGYAVSYKADGERNFLYFASGSKRVEDKGYFIDCNLRIKKSGWYNHGMAGTLIEGEFIRSSNLFLAYDVLFFKGKDVRQFPLEKKASDKNAKDSRMSLLRQYFTQIRDMRPTKSAGIEKGDVRDFLPTIKLKKHLPGVGPDIYQKSKELLEGIKGVEYHVDGLIYTPLDRPYPKLERSNSLNREAKNMSKVYPIFKWKPDELNTIDFLVKTEKNPETNQDVRTPIYLNNREGKLENQVRQAKVLNLFVGGTQTISRNTGNRNSGRRGLKKEFTPVKFNPPRPANPDAGQAKVLLDDKGRMLAIDPVSGRTNEIKDNQIVEFAYNVNSTIPWRPIRVRYDKTERYKRGDPVFGNADFVANDIWENINFPVSTEMLSTGDIPEANLKAPEKTVAQIQAEEAPYYALNQSMERYPYQFFHNKVKSMLFHDVAPALQLNKNKNKNGRNSNNRNVMAGNLLDLACGRGGDLHKWKVARYKNVLGLDLDHDGLEEAEKRYRQMDKPKPNVNFIWADGTKLIFPNYVAAMDKSARDKMQEILVSKYAYDVVSCQFAVHYFFRDEVTLRTFFQNVTDNLTVDGHLIGTCMDGEKVYELLKGKSVVEGKVGADNNVIWKISKEYKPFKMEPAKAQLGKAVRVTVGGLGGEYLEYLVSMEYLETIAKEYGLEKVQYMSFADIYEKAKSDESSPFHQIAIQMNEDEARYSSLNMGFVFKKTENPPDSVFKKLSKLMKKKGIESKPDEKKVVGEKTPRIRKLDK